MKIRPNMCVTTMVAMIGAAGFAASASAQASAKPAAASDVQADPAAVQDAQGLNDIVVTAQKRSENLQDVPISILAVDSGTLENKGITSTVDIGTVASGVNVRMTSSAFLPYIRGIGTNSSSTESPVSLYVDGVYQPYSRGGLRDLGDVEQIAVLKGPQGTLFGRNSTAGVIQITTRTPTQDLRLRAGLSVDNYQTISATAGISGGLTDSISASLSGQYGTQGIGWGKNYTTGNDTHRLDKQITVRGKLVFDPGPDTKVTLAGEYYDQKFVGIARVPYDGTLQTYPGFGPIRSKYDSYSEADGFYSNKGHTISLTIDQSLGFADLLSISAYQSAHSKLVFDNDLVGQRLFLITADQPSRVYTQELQLSSAGSGPFKWVIGGFYFNNKETSDPSTLFGDNPFFPQGAPGMSVAIRRDGFQHTESVAGFAQGTLEFAEGTSLTLGARYTWERRELDASQLFLVAFNPNPAAPGGVPILARQTIKKPSFRVALDHEFTPDVMGYVSFNTGFKSGGYNITSPAAPPYLPENIKAYEAGLKTQLFDRRVRFNIAAFYNDYSNIQVSQVVGGLATVSNAAAAETYGIDMELQASIAPGLEISGAASILHAEYTDYPGAQIATPRPTGGTVLTSGNAAGNRLPTSQKFSANLAADYDTRLAGAGVHFNITGAYQGDYFIEPDNYIRQPSYVMLNSSIKFTMPGDRMSVTVFGKNLLDERILTSGSASAFNVLAIYEAAPRTYGVSFNYAF